MDVKQIDQLWQNKYGWLGPSGQLLVCQLWEHFAVLREVPQLAPAVLAYDSEVSSNEEFMNNCLDELADDEHPEMHRFDGMNDDARDQLIRTVYEQGWLRLGMSMQRSKIHANQRTIAGDPTLWYLEAEGLKSSLLAADRSLRRIQNYLQCELQLVPVQWIQFSRKGLECKTQDPFN